MFSTVYAQMDSDIRCEWGLAAVQHVVSEVDVVIIVDVLSFTTCVEIAVSRDALIFPYGEQDEPPQLFANRVNAYLASYDRNSKYSLSPTQLLAIEKLTRLVLPSPNGSTLSTATGKLPTLAGCLRNAYAVARYAQQLGTQIAIIPAGERWISDHSLRPALEDWIGAGAIIRQLTGRKSPEALAAQHTFQFYETNLSSVLKSIASGKELIDKGFVDDVELASQLNVSATVPRLLDGAYRSVQ